MMDDNNFSYCFCITNDWIVVMTNGQLEINNVSY